jgi:hypothetical protein
MKKNTIYVVTLLLLIIGAILGIPSMLMLATMVAGPEGVDAHVYGIQWTPSSVQNGKIKTTANAIPSDEIGRMPYPQEPNYYYATRWQRPDPYNPDVTFGVYAQPADIEYTLSELKYGVRIRQAQIHEVNIHGDPLGTRNPTEIVWYSWDIKTVETENKVEWKRHEAYIVPADFIFEISCRASKDGSWGAIQDLHYWLVLDTVKWYNAFAKPYGQIESNDPPPEGAELQAYNYRGAFPIWAWVEEWDPFVIENKDGDTYDVNELPDELDQYLEISPSVGGSRLPLYNEPNWQYMEMFASDIVKDNTVLQNALENEYIGNFPDPRFAETVYTPITLSNYGALKQSDGFWITYWEKYYYPTSYIRVRALYAIWGEWIYLWTKQEAEDQGYEWENKTSVIIEHESTWDQFWSGVGAGLEGLLSNPLFWLTSGLVGTFILIALLIVFAGPTLFGFLGAVLGRRARGNGG